jgi:hypothetical protein
MIGEVEKDLLYEETGETHYDWWDRKVIVNGEVDNGLLYGETELSPLKVDQRFAGTCRLSHQGRRVSQARNKCVLFWKRQCISPDTSIGRAELVNISLFAISELSVGFVRHRNAQRDSAARRWVNFAAAVPETGGRVRELSLEHK